MRVWAVSAVTPVASTIEGFRSGTTGFFSSYFELRNAREQSRQLRTEVDRLKLENQFLKNELGSAQRAEALAGFQQHNPSKMIGARVIGATPGMGTRSVLIDRGAQSGVRKGMAVVTPDGIVGTVIAVFPFASQVRSVTDPGFAAGVESQKNHVHGVLKGLGTSSARVDFVPSAQKVEVGEMFYTSGEDRVFPKGLPAGKVTGVRDGTNFQDITLAPSGAEAAPEEVLVILDPVHQTIPEAPPADSPVFLAPDVGSSDQAVPAEPAGLTSADKLREQYKKIGEAQKHVFGEGLPGTPPPNFNLKVPGVNAPAESAGGVNTAGQNSTAKPPLGQAVSPSGASPGALQPAPKPTVSAKPGDTAAVKPHPPTDGTATPKPPSSNALPQNRVPGENGAATNPAAVPRPAVQPIKPADSTSPPRTQQAPSSAPKPATPGTSDNPVNRPPEVKEPQL
jgi:rod shape-determining protein MreC